MGIKLYDCPSANACCKNVDKSLRGGMPIAVVENILDDGVVKYSAECRYNARCGHAQNIADEERMNDNRIVSLL